MFTRLRNALNNLIPRISRWKKPAGDQAADTRENAERKMVYTLAPSRLPSLRQLRYLPRVISRTERLALVALGGLFVACVLFLGARVYARNVVLLPRSGGEVVEGLIGTPQYLNPILVSTNDVDRDLTRLMYSGLFARDGRQQIIPDLAKSYEVSEDRKVYTVRLRDNLRWSDGEQITVDDVLLTFELIQDPLYKSPLRSQFKNLKVERIDETTVKFTLTQASASFMSNLTLGILPAHVWGDVPPPNFALIEYNVKPVGSGPFMFDSLSRDSATGAIKEYRLIRNRNYAGTKPYLEKLLLKIYPDVESAAESLKAKRIDSLSVVPPEYRNKLKQAHLIDLQIPHYTAIYLNMKRPMFKDVAVRKAFAQAVNRSKIVSETLGNAAVIIDGPVPPNMNGYAGTLQPAFDVNAANKALDDAGWKREADGIRKKGNDRLALSLKIADVPEDAAVAQKLKEAWEAIGAAVTIEPFDSARIAKEVIKPRDFDAFLYGVILSQDGGLYPFWHSSQERDPGLNLTNFYNKDADKLLDDLRTSIDPNVVAQKRIEFQKLLAKDQPAIFLYSPLYAYGLSKRVHGFDVTFVTNPSDRFADISKWYVKTKISFK